MKCVVPISGGIDSTVLLHYAKYHYLPERINDVYAISFRYGQKHADYELHCAMQLGRQEAVIHKRVDLKFFKDISSISALTNDNIDIAKTRDVLGDAQTVNYVPFRNQMMLSICCAWAETVGAEVVFHGAAQIDTQAGFWDGSVEFIDALNAVTALNRKHRNTVEAPLIDKSKKEIIEMGLQYGVDFGITWTCYEGGPHACGECTACSSRIKGFIDAGIKDPLPYEKEIPWDTLLEQK